MTLLNSIYATSSFTHGTSHIGTRDSQKSRRTIIWRPQYEGCVDSVVWRMQVAPIRLDPQIVCEAAAFRWEMVEQRLLDVSQCNSRPCQIIFFHD